MTLLWLIVKWYMILEDFVLLDSVRYRDNVMTILMSDWSNLKILMSGWYRRLTSSCVSFTIYKQCHAISRAMSLRHRYNIRMSTGILWNIFVRKKDQPIQFFSITLLRFAFLFIFSLVDLLELASRMEEI